LNSVSIADGCCIQKADKELAGLDAKMSRLDELRLELADFFCGDAKTFRLDDCIKTFHEFFDKFHKATQVCISCLSSCSTFMFKTKWPMKSKLFIVVVKHREIYIPHPQIQRPHRGLPRPNFVNGFSMEN